MDESPVETLKTRERPALADGGLPRPAQLRLEPQSPVAAIVVIRWADDQLQFVNISNVNHEADQLTFAHQWRLPQRLAVTQDLELDSTAMARCHTDLSCKFIPFSAEMVFVPGWGVGKYAGRKDLSCGLH